MTINLGQSSRSEVFRRAPFEQFQAGRNRNHTHTAGVTPPKKASSTKTLFRYGRKFARTESDDDEEDLNNVSNEEEFDVQSQPLKLTATVSLPVECLLPLSPSPLSHGNKHKCKRRISITIIPRTYLRIPMPIRMIVLLAIVEKIYIYL